MHGGSKGWWCCILDKLLGLDIGHTVNTGDTVTVMPPRQRRNSASSPYSVIPVPPDPGRCVDVAVPGSVVVMVLLLLLSLSGAKTLR